MKRILSIAGRLVRTQYSEPKAFVPLLLLPLVFAFIFGTLIFGSRSGGSEAELMPVAYVVQEDSVLATALRAELAESPLIEPIDYTDATEAQTAVTDVDVVAAVTVPAGFEQALLEDLADQVFISINGSTVKQSETNFCSTLYSFSDLFRREAVGTEGSHSDTRHFSTAA
jgi:hypothetical protein